MEKNAEAWDSSPPDRRPWPSEPPCRRLPLRRPALGAFARPRLPPPYAAALHPILTRCRAYGDKARGRGRRGVWSLSPSVAAPRGLCRLLRPDPAEPVSHASGPRRRRPDQPSSSTLPCCPCSSPATVSLMRLLMFKPCPFPYMNIKPTFMSYLICVVGCCCAIASCAATCGSL